MEKLNPKLEEWLKIHTLVDYSNRCAFIVGHWHQMPKDIKKTDILNSNISLSKIEHKLNLDVDKGMIMLKVSIRFVNHLKEKVGDNLPKLFLELRTYFQEEIVKCVFPDAWEWFNDMTIRKAKATRTCRVNAAKHRAMNDRHEIRSFTNNMSSRQAAKQYGAL